VRNKIKNELRGLTGIAVIIAAAFLFSHAAFAATLSPKLTKQLTHLADADSVGMVIVSFHTTNGLQQSHLDVLTSVGVTGGQTFPTLGMVAQPMTAGQVRLLSAHPAVRSVWSNDPLIYLMHQARVMGGVQKVQTDAAMTLRNGGMPISGAGDFSVLVIDSGIDATHQDLQFGTKVIQNVHPVLATSTVSGFTPNVTIENLPNTDETVGHGTHCAGIVGGNGLRSGGLYTGVAPGAKLIGAGLGAGILVINPLGAWEWGLANQYQYNIRVITNSYGPLGGGEFNPDHPIVIASRKAYERNITVVFAAGNDGPAKDTLSPYAQAPWVIGVAAGAKEGELAGFSSRGTPKAERLGDSNPLNDNDAPTITAPGTGRYFESNADRFTSAIVSTRSTLNLTSNGLDSDTELPLGLVPFYTQISGTSMATPYVAGVAALMLDADPTLTPDEIKQIIMETASKMPGYADHEVGAGYINAHAAVDKVLNRSRAYASMQESAFNLELGEERPPMQTFHIDFDPAVEGVDSTNATTFTVEPNMSVLDVFASVDTIAEEGTGNFVGIRITAPDGSIHSTAINTPVIGSNKRQIIVNNPQPGTWTLEVRGARGLAAAPGASSPVQIAAPGPVDGTVVQIKYSLPTIADIQGHAKQEAIEFALRNRLIDTYADGTFRPDEVLTREGMARSLAVNAALRQTLGPVAKFSDVSGDLLNIAEAVTAKGPTLRDFDFVPTGLMASSTLTFNPGGSVNRLDLAVALVKALGHDAAARGLAGTTVTVDGVALTDNAQIPAALRGYVQLAIDKGLFEAFPARDHPDRAGCISSDSGTEIRTRNCRHTRHSGRKTRHLSTAIYDRRLVVREAHGGGALHSAEPSGLRARGPLSNFGIHRTDIRRKK
jgi:serine protease AprX